MNLESQVCNLELAKRLKELGVKQNSLFCWLEGINTSEYLLFPCEPYFPHLDWRVNDKTPPFHGFSAFTVADLGALLPSQYLACFKDESGWYGYNISPTAEWKSMFPVQTEADARAKMLVFLLESKLLTLKDE